MPVKKCVLIYFKLRFRGAEFSKLFWGVSKQGSLKTTAMYFTQVDVLWVRVPEMSCNNVKYSEIINRKLAELCKNGELVQTRIIRFFGIRRGP